MICFTIDFTPALEQAYFYMRVAHSGQVDKAGEPYFKHPLRVMARLGPQATENERITALLHDVMEDYKLGLRGLAVPDKVYQSVMLLSRNKLSQTYNEYIHWIIQHGTVATMRVKLADCYDNADPSRIAGLPTGEKTLPKRYAGTAVKLKTALGVAGNDVLEGPIALIVQIDQIIVMTEDEPSPGAASSVLML